jgi:hypothetical protein
MRCNRYRKEEEEGRTIEEQGHSYMVCYVLVLVKCLTKIVSLNSPKSLVYKQLLSSLLFR